MNILVVEDEPELLKSLVNILKKEHYTVSSAMNGEDALSRIWDDVHDLILLDIMIPVVNGLDVLRQLRQAGIATPVLMLTAKGDVEDKVLGLNLGADDYLAKPFSVAELLARVRALLRRRATANPIIVCKNVTLHTLSREVTRGGQPVPLTSKEFAILEFLLHNRGRAVSRFVLAEHVWGDDFDTFNMSNFVDVHIKNLRKKLQGEGDQLIRTVRGFGYIIDGD